MPEKLEEKTHVWEGLTEYELTSEEESELMLSEYSLRMEAEILKKLKVNEYMSVGILDGHVKGVNLRCTSKFQKVIKELNNMGIDVGKGNSKYGYKMPLPNKDENTRKLIIFRRW